MPTKVLVVCHGNRFRSPLCAAVLSQNPALEVRSAGFREGDHSADKKVRAFAQSMGLDLSEHKSQQVTPELTQWADKIVYMSPENLEKLSKVTNDAGSKAVCLGAYCDPPSDRIRDPASLQGRDFNQVMKTIVGASKKLSAKLSPAQITTTQGRWGGRASGRAGARDCLASSI